MILHGDGQQRGDQAQRCDRQRESAGRLSDGKTDQRWDDRRTERGAWNPIMRSAAAAEVRSAAVRTSSGYIGAVENPNSSTAVVADWGRRLGVPIVFLSACLVIPPLYGVTPVPATRMSVIPFGVAVLLVQMVLFLAIAFGVSALVD